ncbi:MAG: cytidyltransferase [Tissierellia bacterium]|nr:cytidyltransferase [Tissierellia bacterium]
MGFLKKELDKDYLIEYKETLSQFIDNEKFLRQFDSYVKDRSFSVFSLLELFGQVFNKYRDLSQREWLISIYNWLNNKSFPHKGIDGFDPKLAPLYEFYVRTLQKIISLDIYQVDEFIKKHPISFLSSKEELGENITKEYFIFKDVFYNCYINELMHLDMAITNHNTLHHVIGVNHLAMHIGRQLKELKLPVDLGIVVGASLGHDIGKYGVQEEEMGRVPYLHYYYTEEWFNRFSMDDIGHIATNHSTWDLELETLPLESLILIYADFRVKNKVENGNYTMHIFTLEESFEVILNKLDNVDSAKENRYKKVYKRLKDFEDYIVSLGVDTSLSGKLVKSSKKPYELMNKKEVIETLKHLSIEHNIKLMARLTDNISFNSILEMARGETNWRRLRFFLKIFDEYSIYLTQNQKIKTLHFLKDLLLHKGEDIRKEAADLIGKLIALFDEEYRKELPKSIALCRLQGNSEDLLDEFLDMLLFPDHKIADTQREWLYNLKNMIKSLFENSLESHYIKYFDVISKYYNIYTELSPAAQFYLCQTTDYIPVESLDEERLQTLFMYTIKQLDSDNIEVRLATLDGISQMLVKTQHIYFIASIRNWLVAHLGKSEIPSENYLKYIIGRKINLSPNYMEKLSQNYEEGETSEIFLQNLKTATEWVKKKINIDTLYDQVVQNPSNKGLHTAMHLCNLLKVSAIERVRNYAGLTLLNIFHLLSLEERNDVAVELLRALEMESYQFTKFIPDYLGQLLLYLTPKELDEVIDDFEEKIKVSSPRVVILLLNTIAIAIENYPTYKNRFNEDEKTNNDRIIRLLGLLAIGMASYEQDIRSEALRVIGASLFKSNKLSLENKYYTFSIIGKKVLTLINFEEEDDFIFYNDVSSLNHIYKFISDYEFYFGPIDTGKEEKIAFFPGSFDPFSLSHKEIAIEIRDLGFQVYLAVDEFSWSKRTEPHSFRRNIINMSVANEKNINLFPKNIPINISNPEDLNKLRSLFPNQEVYIVVGSDVLINASAYEKNTNILTFPHIIFDRKTSNSQEDDEKKLEVSISKISGETIRLTLPPRYEDISSTQIRENIDLNRDISRLMDPLAMSYIYDNDLYLRAPQYKTLFQSKTIEIDVIRSIDYKTIEEIRKTFGPLINYDHLESLSKKLSYRILFVRNAEDNRLLGFSTFYWVRQNMLYEEFEDTNITDFIRRNVKGRTLLISGLMALDNDEHLIEIVLNETLSLAINRDYNYSLFNNKLLADRNINVEEHLLLQGFLKTDYTYNENPLFMVDMNSPMTLNLDIENMLKPPYNDNPRVLNIISDTRKKLKSALSNLYPGELLITYNKDMIYSKLIQKICEANEVSIIQDKNRILGPNMCVPFGSILNGCIIPNTVTKTMHTEKVFQPNIVDFTIESSPYYLSLEDQAKVLKSFNRRIILVDDLLHKGYRINVIEPILRKEGVTIKKVILGILTGKGKEIGAIKDLDLDYAYFVPNLKLWFNESSQYPFIGGDMVSRKNLESTTIPSINMILPYVSPRFIKNTKNQAIYKLSEVCLLNSLDIFKTIEEVYQSINEKNLNIRGLREIIILPRYPDLHRNFYIDKNIKPSTYIEKDLEILKRLENIVNR